VTAKPLWTHEAIVRARLADVEAILFAVEPGSYSNEDAPLVVQEALVGPVEITQRGRELIATSGPSSIYVTLDPLRRWITVEGELWYRGTYELSERDGVTTIRLSVYNMATGVSGYFAPMMARGAKAKSGHGLEDMAANIEELLSVTDESETT